MRPLFVLLFMINFSFGYGKDSIKKPQNLCRIAINELSNYQVLGVYGSHLESEWHPAAAYVLIREMYRFDVLRNEFQHKSYPWRFEFVEMSGGKIMAFVYNLENRYNYCDGPNAFYVVKK